MSIHTPQLLKRKESRSGEIEPAWSAYQTDTLPMDLTGSRPLKLMQMRLIVVRCRAELLGTTLKSFPLALYTLSLLGPRAVRCTVDVQQVRKTTKHDCKSK